MELKDYFEEVKISVLYLNTVFTYYVSTVDAILTHDFIVTKCPSLECRV